jgi:hypothetical protein
MSMATFFRRVAVVMLVAAPLAGCAGDEVSVPGLSSGDEELTPAQAEMRERADTFNQTVFEGALIGGAIGALSGALFSDGDDRLEGALIGGAVGGVAGGLAGAYVANKQEQYADQEAVLDSMIADVRTKNTEAEALILAMEEVLAEDTRKLASLNAQLDDGQISQASYKEQLAVIEDDKATMKEAADNAGVELANFKEARTIYQEDNEGLETTELDSEIAALEGRISTMNRIVTDLGAGELG